jgi:hypothetical protein
MPLWRNAAGEYSRGPVFVAIPVSALSPTPELREHFEMIGADQLLEKRRDLKQRAYCESQGL